MKHLVRAGVVLGIFLAGFAVLQLAPAPAFLEDFGFHKVSNNEEEWASQQTKYLGSDLCSNCHEETYATWETEEHSSVACEACHGPGQVEHGMIKPEISRDYCGLCHERLVARPSDFPQIDMKAHGGGALCTDCHAPHDPGFDQAPTVPHITEGREDCIQCHNNVGVEGIPSFPQTHLDRTNDECLNCHGGPPDLAHSLDDHDDCLSCHNTTIPDDHEVHNNDVCVICHGGD